MCFLTDTDDFTLATTIFTIPAGPISNTGQYCGIVISANEDTLVEGSEEFDIVITGTNQPNLVSIGASDTTEVTITDNDGRFEK